uniref:DUF4346 domain-containing protein n=1 Tax=Synarthrophyton chejuense TaxID=2485825 RepID=A0A3G3MFK5_9FLOR|nr:hypothetical protein [Synarthrophyton chejuense]AYR05605.1 hypothetical protein [Synarthrophyton chejuense]
MIFRDYFIITIKNGFIVCSYFRYSEKDNCKYCQIDFSSCYIEKLLFLISRHSALSKSISFSHAFYLGKEIYKAQLSIILFQSYVQS